MCQENPSTFQARQKRHQFGVASIVLLVVVCAILLAVNRWLGIEAVVVAGLLVAFWRFTREWRRGPRLVLLTVAIPAAYFAAYFAAVEGKVYRFIGIEPVSGINRYAIEPSFRFRDSASIAFFKPALWVDRHIRNEYWNTVESKSTGKQWNNP